MQYCLHLSTYSWDLQVFYSIRQSDWKPSRTGNFHHKDPLKNCAFWYFYKLLKEPRTDYENMFLNIHNKQSRRFSKTPFFFLNTYSKKAVNAYHFWFFCHQTLLWSLKLVPPGPLADRHFWEHRSLSLKGSSLWPQITTLSCNNQRPGEGNSEDYRYQYYQMFWLPSSPQGMSSGDQSRFSGADTMQFEYLLLSFTGKKV